jgi:hypothetical protein
VFVPAERLPPTEPPLPVGHDQPEPRREEVRKDLPRAEPAGAQGTDFSTQPAPVHPDYEPLRESGPLPGGIKATVAMAMLAIAAGFNLIMAAVYFASWQPAGPQIPVEAVGLLAALNLVVLLTTAIPFWIWFYQAHRNLKRFQVSGLNYTPGWAVGGFLVPIYNLFRPCQVAQEVWKASDPVVVPGDRYGWRKRPVSAVIGWWWACWLFSNLVTALFRIGGEGGDEVGQLLHYVLAIPAALLAILMIKQIRDRQNLKHERLLAG